MTKPPPARDRTTSWKPHNGALQRRGSLQVWLERDMARSADAGNARSIWPWTRQPATSGRRNSPPAARATARCCRSCRNQIPKDEVIGSRRGHAAIRARGGTAIIPIRINGRLWKEDWDAAILRNDILRATRRIGRAIWKKWSGDHVRSRIAARMRCRKSFGEPIASRDPGRQTAEIERAAWPRPGKGASTRLLQQCPLLPDYPAVRHLNPVIRHGGRELLLATRLIASLRRPALRRSGSVAGQGDRTTRAVDVPMAGI